MDVDYGDDNSCEPVDVLKHLTSDHLKKKFSVQQSTTEIFAEQPLIRGLIYQLSVSLQTTNDYTVTTKSTPLLQTPGTLPGPIALTHAR